MKQACSGVRRKARSATSSSEESVSEPVPFPEDERRSQGNEDESYTSLMQNLLSTLSESRGFYANIADSICNDPAYSSTGDINCWNGKNLGE